MDSSAKKLVEIFDYLPEQDQKTLLEFAEFLQSRAPEPKSVITEPLDIPRPEAESVVSAIKRLKQNYPMVEHSHLFNETSELMMQHMMQGRKADDIIDELEILFEEKFKLVIEKHK
ncbi:MAG: Crp/Fnr family transcriptional regulator [Gammaproteobacteria bacterium]|nr:Crp/Fnr family transcriptional regulator [Gammaproteobacteria bacterium]